jgi:low affinity Fe/Cu permease
MKNSKNLFEIMAGSVTRFAGTTTALVLALFSVLIWGVIGPLFNFSDTWQLVMNTATSVITFLMVFLIQRAQNKDSQALHLKLNELVASLKGPSNRLIDVESLSEKELKILSQYYRHLSEMAQKEIDLSVSHSIEEAEDLHKSKLE